jgi:hypothetical protein
MEIRAVEQTFTQWIRCRHPGCCQSWVFQKGQDTHYEAERVTHEKTCWYKPHK